VPPVAAVAPTPAPSDDALGLPTGDISIPAGSITADGKIAIELLSAPLVGPGSGPLGGPGAGAPPRDRSFNGVGVARKPGTAHPMPGLRTPDQARPVTPGFGDTHTPPAGSTVRTGLPGSRLGQAPHGTSGSAGKPDGFEDWVSSIVSERAPAPSLQPRPMAQPPQRLMGVADVLSGAHVTMGGPASAVPPKTMAESDFYVMRPTRKKPKGDRAAPARPRPKLATSVFLLVLVVVLAGVAVAFFYVH